MDRASPGLKALKCVNLGEQGRKGGRWCFMSAPTLSKEDSKQAHGLSCSLELIEPISLQAWSRTNTYCDNSIMFSWVICLLFLSGLGMKPRDTHGANALTLSMAHVSLSALRQSLTKLPSLALHSLCSPGRLWTCDSPVSVWVAGTPGLHHQIQLSHIS